MKHLWIFVAILATCITTFRNSFFRLYPLEFSLTNISIWVGLGCSILMMASWGYCFGTAPSFFIIWFLGTAMLSIAGFLISKLYFTDPISISNVIGCVLVFIGGLLIVK